MPHPVSEFPFKVAYLLLCKLNYKMGKRQANREANGRWRGWVLMDGYNNPAAPAPCIKPYKIPITAQHALLSFRPLTVITDLVINPRLESIGDYDRPYYIVISSNIVQSLILYPHKNARLILHGGHQRKVILRFCRGHTRMGL